MIPNNIIQEILEHAMFNVIGELTDHTLLSELTTDIVKSHGSWIYFRDYGFFSVSGHGATHLNLVACYDMMKNKHKFSLNDTEQESILDWYQRGDLTQAWYELRVCYDDFEDYLAIVKYPVVYHSRAGNKDTVYGASNNFTPEELNNFYDFNFEYDV